MRKITDLAQTVSGLIIRRPLFFGDLDDTLGDDGAREGGAQEVLVLVHRARLHGGIDVVFDELFAQILDIQLGSARLERLLFQPFQLALLPYVGGDGDDFAVVIVLFQPRDDDGRIQPAGIRKNNFFDFLFHFVCFLSLNCEDYTMIQNLSQAFAHIILKIFRKTTIFLNKLYNYA